MFSFFRKKPKQQEHPLFGPLVYRTNRNKQAGLAGFWEGCLDLGLDEPTKLIIWGDAKTHPHPKQGALFNRVVEGIEDYVAQSKEGLWQHIQEEKTPIAKGTWTLNHLYFQAYPMSARLQEDLPAALQNGVAWGLAFDIEGLLEEGQMAQGYSALVDQDWHPTFPFTYY
ncbi:MAG: hypothetical protein ACRBFS_23340 [Aureispira sp.]